MNSRERGRVDPMKKRETIPLAVGVEGGDAGVEEAWTVGRGCWGAGLLVRGGGI